MIFSLIRSRIGAIGWACIFGSPNGVIGTARRSLITPWPRTPGTPRPSAPRRGWCTISVAPMGVDRDGLKRLIKSINRVLEAGDAVADGSAALPEIEIERVFELGVVLAARQLWEDLGIGAAIRRCAEEAGLTAPHETALFAMAAQRLEQPGSKLACATNWLPDVAFLPEAEGLGVDQLYRALDFLLAWSEEVERDVFLQAADLFRLDVDLIFYDTTTAYPGLRRDRFRDRRRRRRSHGMGRPPLCPAAPARP